MSPTLLELIVAVSLLWIAWQIGAVVAPRVIAAFLSFWRTPRPQGRPADGWRQEKNITPPTTPEKTSPSSTHGHTGT